MKLFLCVVFASIILHTCKSQECASSDILEYVDSYNNASEAVLIEIEVIAKAIISGFNATNSTNSSQLYEVLSAALNVEASSENLANFQIALDQITDSYFQSCYGSLEDRPTVGEVGTLVYNLINQLNGLTVDNSDVALPEIRSMFGRISCIIDTYSNDELTANGTTVPSMSSITPTPTQTLALPTATPTPTPSVNCSNLSGTYISISVFYQCVDSHDLQPIFGFGPIVSAGDDLIVLKRCIGFVVDTTGSMSHEISYVRQLILNFVDSESTLPACYALVDFNDYGYSNPDLSEFSTI